MFKLAIPVLHVASSVAAEDFYCKLLGFSRSFAYRPDTLDPCYLGLKRDDVEIRIRNSDSETDSQ